MKFSTHSSDYLFNKKLNEYASHKLQKPVIRHDMDSDSVSMRVDAAQVGTLVELRLTLHVPGSDVLKLTSAQSELAAAIDSVADKLQRCLRDLSDKKVKGRRRTEEADYTEDLGEDDYLTDGEEDVLREMGALDKVLGI
jgi:ribosome-associated translation inhibitor RaiA